MKILQINKLYPPHLGGVENVVKDIAEFLAKDASWQSDVLVCQEKGKRQIEKSNGVNIFRSASFGRLLSLPISFDFFRLFKKIYSNYDLLLIHHPFPLASLARFLFLKNKKPIAIWYHSDIVRQKLFYFLVYPFLYLDLKSANIIFVSSYRLAEKSSLLSKFLNKCQVIPFGVDLSIYEKDYTKEVNDLKNKYGRFILSVGRLVYYKGYLNLLEAIKDISVKLLIIGSGPLKLKMDEYINNNNLVDKVFIIDNHPNNIIPYYQACEFLVFPSNARSEAFGLVQIEAMACGKPVINTNLETGVPEVSLDNKTGLTVPVNDCQKLSEAIKLLWEDNDMCLQLGINAKERAKEVFSKTKFEDNLKNSLIKIK